MTAVEELHALYGQWRQHSQVEGRAIEANNWDLVNQCQSAKSLLQPRIIEVSARIEAFVHDLQFRPVVDDLMELERQNSSRLESRRQSAHDHRRELDRSTRHLRQLHQSYVPPRRTNWQSYS